MRDPTVGLPYEPARAVARGERVLALALLTAGVWLALGVGAWREHRAMPRLTGKLPKLFEPADVLVIVPARNEAEVVERCLRGLLAQQGVNLQAVLYDDRSTDDTARRAEDVAVGSGGRLTVVRGAVEPPPDWCGKPHALMAALGAAGFDIPRGKSLSGPTPHLLAFVDADVVLRPTALAELAELMQERSCALGTALPHLVCRSFWEKVAGPSVGALVTARHRPSRVNNPKDPSVLANGQLIMVTPHAYTYVGGHAAVKAEVLEDVALARAIKQSGHRVVLADGQKVMATRMYDGLAELWEGWGKNAYPLAGGTPGRVLMYAVASVLLGTLPTVHAVMALLLAADGAWVAAGLTALGWVVPLGVQMGSRRMGGQSPAYAFLAPVGGAVLAALLVSATWKAVRGKPVAWKGRRYLDGRGAALPERPQP